MSAGKFLVRWIVVFIVSNALGFVGHGFLLKETYLALSRANPGIMRTEEDSQAHFLWMLLAFAIQAAAIVWIYAKGNTGGAWLGQGIRFGIAIWAVSSAFMYLIYYDVQPWPGMVTAKQMGWDFIALLLVGIVIAALSKNDAVVARSKSASA
jgi:hypothetical protein